MKSVLVFLTGATLAICLLFTAVQAYAQDYTRSGAYVGAGGLLASQDFSDTEGVDVDTMAEQAYAPDYARSGAYVGAGGLMAFQDFSDTEGVGVNNAMAPVFNLKAGYRFLPNFAVELDFSYLDHWDVGDVAEASFLTFSTKAKAYLSTGDTQPYINFGIGMAKGEVSPEPFGPETSIDETAYATSFGGGIDFYAREDIVFYVEAAYYVLDGNLNDFNFIPVTAGIQFR